MISMPFSTGHAPSGSSISREPLYVGNGREAPRRFKGDNPLPDLNGFKGGGVYFLQIQNADGFVKIGWAAGVHSRVLTLVTACPYPVKMIGLRTGGTRKMESDLHLRLYQSRHYGEWFWPTREVLHAARDADDFIRWQLAHANDPLPAEQLER